MGATTISRCQSKATMLKCAMTLEDRLSNAVGAFVTERKRMFGGLCFMLNGNMLMGTFRGGMMVRVAKETHAQAMAMPGASAMVMKDRVMEGFILIEASAVEEDETLQKWVDMALAYNATLPPKASKPVVKKSKK
jgi:TfoX/Sxy family transcriptional regulator of competence genes